MREVGVEEKLEVRVRVMMEGVVLLKALLALPGAGQRQLFNRERHTEKQTETAARQS